MFHRTCVHIIFSSVWVAEALLMSTHKWSVFRAKWKCEVFHRRGKLQKNMNNNIQMKSKQIEGHHYVTCECVHVCISYLIFLVRLLLMSANVTQCLFFQSASLFGVRTTQNSHSLITAADECSLEDVHSLLVPFLERYQFSNKNQFKLK